LIIDNTGLDKAKAATTSLDLGADGELKATLTVINANVRVMAARLAEAVFTDSTVTLDVDAVAVLRASDSHFTQARDIEIGELSLSGGGWSQAGFALDAKRYEFVGSLLDMSGAFGGAQTDLVVEGFTVALHRSATWKKVRVLSGGVITTPLASEDFTQAIAIKADEIEVDASSRIDVSGKGRLGTLVIGPYTGGSHGGTGGLYQSGPTNTPYGDFREPWDFGSGGRGSSNNFTRGGGALVLETPLLRLGGLIQANGQYQGNYYGSGSGGSILLRVGTLELGAEALIQANGGGDTGYYSYGGGGGGRIAVHFQQVDRAALVQRVQARGGYGRNAQHGSAGTVYLNDLSSGQAELIIDNTGLEKAKAATTLLDLGADGELTATLTVINANVRVMATRLAEAVFTDSTVTLDVDAVAVLRASGSHFTQARDIEVGELSLNGGGWNQAGFALNAERYDFVDRGLAAGASGCG